MSEEFIFDEEENEEEIEKRIDKLAEDIERENSGGETPEEIKYPEGDDDEEEWIY